MPQPKNTFIIRVNDIEYYSLVKEEVEYDPTKTEKLSVFLKINGQETIGTRASGASITGKIPWIIEDMEDKIQTALGMGHLNSLEISNLHSKSSVANEFLDSLTCCDLSEHGLNKLSFGGIALTAEPFEEEVVARMAKMCP